MSSVFSRAVPAALVALMIAGAATDAAAAPNSAIAAIRTASNPSAAIQAYADGYEAYRENPRFLEAFVRRMIDLDSPEQAYSQARLLAALQPENAYAWAAAAYNEAKLGRPAEAAANLLFAINKLPGDPFVLRTSGQLLAWYDAVADREKLDYPAKAAFEGLRKNAQSSPVYAEAYQAAVTAYSGLPAPMEETPPASQPALAQYEPADVPQNVEYDTSTPPSDYGAGSNYRTGSYPWWGGWSGRPVLVFVRPSFGFHGGFIDPAGTGAIVTRDGRTLAITPNSTILFDSSGQPVKVVPGTGTSLLSPRGGDSLTAGMSRTGSGVSLSTGGGSTPFRFAASGARMNHVAPSAGRGNSAAGAGPVRGFAASGSSGGGRPGSRAAVSGSSDNPVLPILPSTGSRGGGGGRSGGGGRHR